MFCISCGKKIPDGMGFCPYCGAAQRGGGQAAPSPAPAPASGPAPASDPAPAPSPAAASGPASAPSPAAKPAPASGASPSSAAPAASAPAAPASPTALVPNVDDKRLGQIACALSAVVVVLELAGLHQVCLVIGAVAALWLLVNIVKK